MGFLLWIIGGIIAGWLTGQIMKGEGFGLFGDLAVGLVGGLLGGWLAGLLGLGVRGWIGQIVLAVIGGVILVAALRAIRR